MKSDAIIRTFREQPELFSSFQALIAEQREKILSRVTAAPGADELFRLQGELRALTNLMAHLKTMLGNSHARTNGHARPEAR